MFKTPCLQIRTDRLADRRINRSTNGQTDLQADWRTDEHTDGQTDWRIDRRTVRPVGGLTDRHDRQTGGVRPAGGLTDRRTSIESEVKRKHLPTDRPINQLSAEVNQQTNHTAETETVPGNTGRCRCEQLQSSGQYRRRRTKRLFLFHHSDEIARKSRTVTASV